MKVPEVCKSVVLICLLLYFLAIRWGFPLSRMTTNNYISPMKFCYNKSFAIIKVLHFLNNPKHLDPSYKTDLDFWDCFGKKKNLSYNLRK